MIRTMLTTLILLVATSSVTNADTSVSKLKKIATKLTVLLIDSPILYDVSYFSRSPSGQVVIPYRWTVGHFKIDVKRTNSIVTPLVGEIRFNAIEQSTANCGSVKSYMEGEFFASSTNEAVENTKNERCWRNNISEPFTVFFMYDYTDGKWELSRITSQPTGIALLINYALGMPTDGRLPTELNSHWLALVRSVSGYEKQ